MRRGKHKKLRKKYRFVGNAGVKPGDK